MKPTRACLSIASASLALVGIQPDAQAATIVRELTVQVMGAGQVDVLFDPVDDVTDLVSISDGSVSVDEGGSMQISAILDNDDIVLLFSGGTPGVFNTTSLFSITGNNFSEFASPVTVKGLRFQTIAGPTIPATLTLPVGTQFVFAVPEPTATMLSMLGLVMLTARRRRA